MPGSGTGDLAADTVTVTGTKGDDVIEVQGQNGALTVTGLPEVVTVTGSEAIDALIVSAGAGNDTLSAATLPADNVTLTLDGGAGNDTIVGSQGADVLLGGDGSDTVTGGRGNDTALLGNGNDTFIWNPGDGSDVVEGGAGTDRLVFNGANIGENMDISANGGRVRLTRDIGGVTMDLNGVEKIQVNAAGGADNITINDLTRTGVTQVAIDLSGPSGSGQGDGAADSVTVNGTAGRDSISVATIGASVVVNGLSAPRAPTTRSSSAAALATTPSTPPRSTPARSSSPSMAAPAMTSSPPARAMTSLSAGKAATRPCSGPAMTRSCGIRVMAATWSMVKQATTRSSPRAPTSPRTSTSLPMPGMPGWCGISPPSRWISTTSRPSMSRP